MLADCRSEQRATVTLLLNADDVEEAMRIAVPPLLPPTPSTLSCPTVTAIKSCKPQAATYPPTTTANVVECTIHGTVVKTAAPYKNRFISVITIEGRKIAHWRDYLDPLAVFAALGG